MSKLSAEERQRRISEGQRIAWYNRKLRHKACGNATNDVASTNRPGGRLVAYRERWVDEILAERSVLSLALDVHMTTTGAMDRSPDEQEKDLKALQEIERTWTNRHICDFDEAAFALVSAAIKEAS